MYLSILNLISLTSFLTASEEHKTHLRFKKEGQENVRFLSAYLTEGHELDDTASPEHRKFKDYFTVEVD